MFFMTLVTLALAIGGIGPTFASLVAESFDQIRESAKGNVTIVLRVLVALQTIARVSRPALRG